MASFDLNTINSALTNLGNASSGVDFSGKSLKLDTVEDAKPIVDAINACANLQFLALTGNTLGVAAAQAISKALEHHPELKDARFSDMFTGRMKTEIPPALSALGDGMIAAGARLSVLDLSDNAFGPIGVQGLANLLQSDVCSQLQVLPRGNPVTHSRFEATVQHDEARKELRLNNNGLGITGGRLLAKALSTNPLQLRVFIAGRNRLENDGATALAKVLQQMGTLEEVAMPQNGIYHVGISALSEAFKHNPHLSCVNLNDNTIGSKGAKAFASAMPSLKNLKSVNFGDCLLKSKGATELAKGLKDNSILIESLDLSHNEIGREACMELVDALTVLPDSSDRLTRVVLSGNSLGGSANKKCMKDKLGASAELSDGEGSDDEYVTDSEEEQDSNEEDTEYSEEENTEDSATEDAQHLDTIIDVKDISLDTSGVEEVESTVGRFLQEPTIENFHKLGPNAAELIDTHLQAIKNPIDIIEAYVEATFCVSGLSIENNAANEVAGQLYPILVKRAGQQHAASWTLTNTMLRGLGLIKAESKDFKIRWNIPGCFHVLGRCMQEEGERALPVALRDTLKFFITTKLPSLSDEVRQIVEKQPALKQ